MKNVCFLIAASASLALLSACSGPVSEPAIEAAEKPKTVVVANRTSEFAVDGMVCAEGCAGTIQEALSDLEGVGSCTVDFASGKVSVAFDTNAVSMERLIATVEGIHEGQYSVRH